MLLEGDPALTITQRLWLGAGPHPGGRCFAQLIWCPCGPRICSRRRAPRAWCMTAEARSAPPPNEMKRQLQQTLAALQLLCPGPRPEAARASSRAPKRPFDRALEEYRRRWQLPKPAAHSRLMSRTRSARSPQRPGGGAQPSAGCPGWRVGGAQRPLAHGSRICSKSMPEVVIWPARQKPRRPRNEQRA